MESNFFIWIKDKVNILRNLKGTYIELTKIRTPCNLSLTISESRIVRNLTILNSLKQKTGSTNDQNSESSRSIKNRLDTNFLGIRCIGPSINARTTKFRVLSKIKICIN